MCWTHRAQPGGRGRGERSEADWSKQRFGSLNKTFVCDWGFVMWTAWPVLLGVSEQPARHPRRNRSMPLPADPQPIHIAWEQIFLTTWVIDLYKAQMFSLCAEASSEWHKLPLIKFLTIHGKWVSSVNTVQMVLVWGLLGNKAPRLSQHLKEAWGAASEGKHEDADSRGSACATQPRAPHLLFLMLGQINVNAAFLRSLGCTYLKWKVWTCAPIWPPSTASC